ncbi:hypothetical protein CBER1_10669 [Cercospora berteroae]|uniref:Uncharacterized protein n=1 Tax=Cercospora berteroae TaxID=357750 RepID=A0A2S6CMY9_9PEZI|nr:hypothetical protein CBER1_10669 [Cercospora berteroae]
MKAFIIAAVCGFAATVTAADCTYMPSGAYTCSQSFNGAYPNYFQCAKNPTNDPTNKFGTPANDCRYLNSYGVNNAYKIYCCKHS